MFDFAHPCAVSHPPPRLFMLSRNMNKGIKSSAFTRKPQMSELILFNKPYGVICQFSAHPNIPAWRTMSVSRMFIPPAGWIPTARAVAAHRRWRAATPDQPSKMQTAKTYWAQVEGVPDDDALAQLRARVDLGDFVTQPARCGASTPPACGRARPIRVRQSVPDSWLEIIIHEAKTARCGA